MAMACPALLTRTDPPNLQRPFSHPTKELPTSARPSTNRPGSRTTPTSKATFSSQIPRRACPTSLRSYPAPIHPQHLTIILLSSDPPDAIHPTAATMDTLAVFMIAIVIPVSFLVALLALLLRHLQYDGDSWEHCKQV